MTVPGVSVCMPTYNRGRFLREALVSCLEQQYANIEILVGDDSNDVTTQTLCKDLGPQVRYFGNPTRLGQAGNMNRLLDVAGGEMVMVLHDDDRLVAGALKALADALAWDRDAVGAYGWQQIIDEHSTVDAPASDALNRSYFRTPEYEGARLPIMAAALRQQLPNDGYLLRSASVKGQRFPSFQEVGDACDFAFGLAIARVNPRGRFLLLNRVTSQYRVHGTQVSRRPTMYPMLRALERMDDAGLDEATRAALLDVKDGLARRSIRELLAVGRKREARGVMLSRSMRFRRQLVRNLACLALSYVPGDAVGRYFDRHAPALQR